MRHIHKSTSWTKQWNWDTNSNKVHSLYSITIIAMRTLHILTLMEIWNNRKVFKLSIKKEETGEKWLVCDFFFQFKFCCIVSQIRLRRGCVWVAWMSRIAVVPQASCIHKNGSISRWRNCVWSLDSRRKEQGQRRPRQAPPRSNVKWQEIDSKTNQAGIAGNRRVKNRASKQWLANKGRALSLKIKWPENCSLLSVITF